MQHAGCCRIESNHRRELRHANACIVQRVANPLFQRSCEPNAAEGMQRGELEDRNGRNADRFPGFSPGEQLPRAAPHAAYVAFGAPQPDVGIEQQQTQLRSMLDLLLIGSKGCSYLSTVPFREPKNDFFAGSETAPASPRAFHAWSDYPAPVSGRGPSIPDTWP